MINQERQHDDHDHERQQDNASKRAEKAALKAGQRAESASIKSSSHNMKTRSSTKGGPIVQPGKFGRDMHRSF